MLKRKKTHTEGSQNRFRHMANTTQSIGKQRPVNPDPGGKGQKAEQCMRPSGCPDAPIRSFSSLSTPLGGSQAKSVLTLSDTLHMET